MRLTRFAMPAAVSGLLTLALSVPLHAQANQALLDRFKSAMAEEGTRIEWKSVSSYDNAEGKPVTALDGVTIDTGDAPVELAKIELIAPEQTNDGYTIEKVLMPSWQYADDAMTASVNDVSLEGVVLTKEGIENAYGTSILYDNARLGEVRVSMDNAEIFTLTDVNVAIDAPEDGGEMTFEGAAEGFTLALSKIDNPSAKAAASAMGYDTVEGYLEFDGSWEPGSGKLALTQFDITGVDAGTFGLKLDLGGYTPAFMKSLRQMQEQLANAPEDADNSAAGLAMLGLMQQLTFTGAEISFNDDSLTGKVLDYFASQQGQTPQVIANQAKAVVPFMMMQLNNPEFTQMVTTAVSAFLDDPQSLKITARPTAPVPFALIVAGAMSAPQGLPQQLGVTVTANE